MKKTICCLLVILVTAACAVFACAEEFELEHGIRFGMTKEEIIEKVGQEPENKDNDEFISYRDVEAEGYEHSVVEYHFDEQGKLDYVYESLHTDQDAAKLEKEYKAQEKVLKGLYGKPIGNKNGKTDELVSSALSNAFLTQQIAKAAKSTTKMSYNEWKVETEGGIVKIDQIYTMSNNKATKIKMQDHVICYRLFPGGE